MRTVMHQVKRVMAYVLTFGLVFPTSPLQAARPQKFGKEAVVQKGEAEPQEVEPEVMIEEDLQGFLELQEELAAKKEESEPILLKSEGSGDPTADTIKSLADTEVVGNGLVFQTSTSLAVIPGPNGMTPKITFVYSTQNGMSISGVGFEPSFNHFIEVDTRYIDLDSGDAYWAPKAYFRVSAPGVKGELVYSEANSDLDNDLYVYYPNRISGPVTKFLYDESSNSWVAEGPDGREFYFDEAVTNNCSSAYEARTLRWYLTSVKDAYGNEMDYDWEINPVCKTDTELVKVLEFEPLLQSITYAQNGSNFYKIAFTYVTSDGETTWNSDFWLPYGEPDKGNTEFHLKLHKKVKKIEMQYCEGSRCETARSLRFDYASYSDDKNLVYVAAVHHCGLEDECLPPTRFVYDLEIDNDSSDGVFRMRQIIHPMGGATTVTYARLKGRPDEPYAIWSTGKDPEKELHDTDPLVTIRRELCEEVAMPDRWDGTVLPCDRDANRYETRYYCLDPYFDTSYDEFRGCHLVETRQVVPGSDTRLPGGITTLTQTNIGREKWETLLSGTVEKVWTFSHADLTASTCTQEDQSGCAWSNKGSAIQEVTYYPEAHYAFCRNDIRGNATDCLTKPRTAIAMVSSPVVRTDSYDADGEKCTSDACRVTVIQRKEYDLGTDTRLDWIDEAAFNLEKIQFFRLDGAAAKGIPLDTAPSESTLRSYASNGDVTEVRFAYIYDKAKPHVRKLGWTAVFSSKGVLTHQMLTYDTESTENGRLGNVAKTYLFNPDDFEIEVDRQRLAEYFVDRGKDLIDYIRNHGGVEMPECLSSGSVPVGRPYETQTPRGIDWGVPGGIDRGVIGQPEVPNLPTDPVLPGTCETPTLTLPWESDRILWGEEVIEDAPGYAGYALLSETSYNSRGLPVESTTYFTQDRTDFLTTTTSYDGELGLYPVTVTLQYDMGDLVTETDYDIARGLVTSTRVSSDGSPYTTSFQYDSFGRLTKSWDDFSSANQPLQTVEYDPNYKWIKTEALTSGGYVTSVDHYDGLGRVTYKVAGPFKQGSTTGYIMTAQAFNEAGQTVRVWHPQWVATADPTHVKVFQSALTPNPDADCRVEPYCVATSYDPLGRQNKVESPNLDLVGGFAEIQSRIQGPAIAQLGPDVMTNMRGANQPGELYPYYKGHTQVLYDGFGKVKEMIELCNTEKCGSEDEPRSSMELISIDDVADGPWYGARTTYEYEYRAKADGSGVDALLTKITDSKGNITEFEYDALGRRVRMNDPDAGETLYRYDLSGNLVWSKDARGVESNFTYRQGLLVDAVYADEANRREYLSNTYGEGSDCPAGDATRPNMLSSSTVSFERDSHPISSFEVGFCYDTRGRVTRKTYSFDPAGEIEEAIPAIDQQIEFSWTIDNQIESIRLPEAFVTLNYSYCGDSDSDCSPGQMVRIEGSVGSERTDYVKRIAYNSDGQMTDIWYGNGYWTYYRYEPDTKLLSRIYTCLDSDRDRICEFRNSGETIPTPDDEQDCTVYSTAIQDIQYDYQPGGNIYQIISKPTACVDVDGDGLEDLAYNASKTVYLYDGVGRLMEAKSIRLRLDESDIEVPDSLPEDRCLYHRVYKYDAIGNMRHKEERCRPGEKFSWDFRYGAGSAGPHQLTEIEVNNVGSGYETPGAYGCSDGKCTLTGFSYDPAGNTERNMNPHNGWNRFMTWTPRGQLEAVAYCPPESSCDGSQDIGNYLEFLYDHRNLRYFKYQPESVKDDFNQPSWTVYFDKLLELGVRDQNIELTGTAIQKPYEQLHLFLGGVDPSTGDIAPGTRRIGSVDLDDLLVPEWADEATQNPDWWLRITPLKPKFLEPETQAR